MLFLRIQSVALFSGSFSLLNHFEIAIFPRFVVTEINPIIAVIAVITLAIVVRYPVMSCKSTHTP